MADRTSIEATGFTQISDGLAHMSKFEQVVTDLGLDASYISSNHTLNMPNRLNYVTIAIPSLPPMRPCIPSHLHYDSQILHIAKKVTASKPIAPSGASCNQTIPPHINRALTSSAPSFEHRAPSFPPSSPHCPDTNKQLLISISAIAS